MACDADSDAGFVPRSGRCRLVPIGTADNSPGRKPWDSDTAASQAPEGRQRPADSRFFRPSGAWLVVMFITPGLAPWAIIFRPSGTTTVPPRVGTKPAPTRSRTIAMLSSIQFAGTYPHSPFVFPRIALLVRPRFNDPTASSSEPILPPATCRSKYFMIFSGRNRVRCAMP